MAKIPLVCAGVVLAVSLLAAACGTTATTTTVTKKPASTTSTSHKVAASTTSSTLQLETWTPVAYEQGTPGLSYAGGWTYSSATDASKGGFIYTDKSGASVTFRFVGTHCAWLAKTSDKYGKATVTVDDGTAVTVDLYSKTVVWRHMVWETKTLPFGEHTVKIERTGKKRTASKGTCINVDSVEVIGALVGRYQQNNDRFDYEGTWKTSKTDSASGGSFTLTKTSKSSVTVTFTGIQLDWYAKKGPAYGKARVILDDGDPVTFDLYSKDEVWKQQVWSSSRLEMGTHVVTIKWTGLKSSAATDSYINVDSFEIAGALVE
jgi:hypothetical protein